MRAVGGLVVGLIIGLIAAIVIGIIGVGSTFSLPAGVDPADSRQVLQVFANIPAATQLVLGLAWTAAGLVGAFVARRVGREAWAAWGVTILVAAYFGYCGFILPLLAWAKALWLIGPLAGGVLGNRPPRARVAVVPAADSAGEI